MAVENMEKAALNNAEYEMKCTLNVKNTALRSFRLGYHYIENEMLENMQYYMEYVQENGYITPQEWLKNYKHF